MQLEQLILDYLQNQKRKRIKTREIEKFVRGQLGVKEYQKLGGYDGFARAINKLVEKERIRPIAAWGRNGLIPELHNGYKLIIKAKLKPEIKRELLTDYHPRINTTYYLRHPADYQQDREYLKQLDQFLKKQETLKPMSINERSFQIFNIEKYLSSTAGRTLLKRTGLNERDLKCFRASEPFFYFEYNKYNKQRKNKDRKLSYNKLNTLIVENKDTFVSFKKLFQEGINSWESVSFHLLIYGEGKKILRSFSFFSELQYRQENTDFYYFGDLDPEGIKIWYKLRQDRDINLKPAVFFYIHLLTKYFKQAPVLETEQYCSQEAIAEFCSYFSGDNTTDRIRRLLQGEYYLPQEGLNYSLLKEMGDQEKCCQT